MMYKFSGAHELKVSLHPDLSIFSGEERASIAMIQRLLKMRGKRYFSPSHISMFHLTLQEFRK